MDDTVSRAAAIDICNYAADFWHGQLGEGIVIAVRKRIEQLPAVPTCDDAVSRQAAIDVLSLGKEILSRVLDDMDVVGTDREKYSWGLGLIESNIKDIEELPSAQPQSEIIRCKDCMHNGSFDTDCPINWNGKEYCSFAERRTDEQIW